MVTTERISNQTLWQDQMALEARGVRQGVMKYRELVDRANDHVQGGVLKASERLILHWMKPMVSAIRDLKRTLRTDTRGGGVGRAHFAPFLYMIHSERIALVTIRQVLSICIAQPTGVPLARAAYSVGREIVGEICVDIMKRNHRDQMKELTRHMRARSRGITGARLSAEIVNKWANASLDEPKWNRSTLSHLGTAMIWTLVGVASSGDYDGEWVQSIRHERRREAGKIVGYIRMSNEALDVIDAGHEILETMRPRFYPMLTPPCAWTNYDEGGYIRIRTPLILRCTQEQRDAARRSGQPLYDGLNALNSQAWRVNRKMLAIVEEIVNAGGGSGIPLQDNFPFPERPDDIDTNPESLNTWKQNAAKVYDRNAELISKRLTFHNTLHMAKLMAEADRIYMPHQIDFRGRAYPTPTHLSHHGNDLCRSLLEFADDRPVDERWLKIHAASTYGVDKVSFDERVAWADRNARDIERSVIDPLGCDFWQLADGGKKPLQFLAACLALVDPKSGSHLPCQIDGTCNGLQHYAALMRDERDAESVNMTPRAEPSDIYSLIADIVRIQVERDAGAGNPIAQSVSDHVERSVVKQNVMTNVYGVTAIGARQQVKEKLRIRGLHGDPLYKGSFYLANVTMQTLADECRGSAACMRWIREMASQITKENKKSLIRWTSPIGLEVVQPYRNWSSVVIVTMMQKLKLQVEGGNLDVKRGKHTRSMPPNFIHSVDSSHMMMAATASRNAGIAFGAVHDGFWSHSASMGELSRVLRSTFVRLHEQYSLSELHAELQRRFGAELPAPPELSAYDIKQVIASDYMFS